MPVTPAPRSLWLLRHAESEGNVADAAATGSGQQRLELQARDADMPLSRTGEGQAVALGRAWALLPDDQRPTVVLSSPYERAHRTALLAVETAGLDLTIHRDERLRERDLGVLDGLTKHGIEAMHPEEAERRAWIGKFYYRAPGAESWADVAGRVRAVLDAALPRHEGERVVVASHQAVIMVARYVLEEMTEAEVLEVDATARLANTGLVRYRFDDGRPVLEDAGDTRHLDQEHAPVTEEPDADAVSG